MKINYSPWCGRKLLGRNGMSAESTIYKIAGGDIVLWSVAGSIHIKIVNAFNDPVELNEDDALELSKLLSRLVENG